MNDLPIRIELVSAPGVAIQDGTALEDNDAVTDPIVAALAQLVRDAYANEQQLRARFRVLEPSEVEAESMTSEVRSEAQEPTGAIEPERRKSA